MVFKKLIVLLLLVHGILFAKSVNVAVAANVSYAIKDLLKEFNKLYPDIKVRVVLGSSGKLTAQIKNKAPIDIFMSADMRYPEALYSQKIATTKPTVYAQGVLALLSVKKRDFSKGIKEYTPGSVFIFYSDGVTEAMNEKDEMYLEERLVRLARSLRGKTTEEIVNAIQDDVAVFAGKAPQHDDITVMAVEV
jgi:hypothetical protein